MKVKQVIGEVKVLKDGKWEALELGDTLNPNAQFEFTQDAQVVVDFQGQAITVGAQDMPP